MGFGGSVSTILGSSTNGDDWKAMAEGEDGSDQGRLAVKGRVGSRKGQQRRCTLSQERQRRYLWEPPWPLITS